MVERPVIFDCAGDKLIGILAEPSASSRVGVLLLVGGPQYRVGSHRQFLLLARGLAEAGIPAMRFDYRGMGDSTGSASTFEKTVQDIAAAIDTFKAMHSSLDRVVLWGLCDAASAALLYWRATRDSRAAGMILLNPWIRSEQSLASAHIKHYYGKRLLEQQFWAKLTRGGIDIAEALRDFARTAIAARRSRGSIESDVEVGFQDRMARGLGDFAGPVLIILSGQDFTAKEFLEYVASNSRWRGLIARENVERADLAKADHTFSTAAWRQEVEALTLDWLKRCFRQPLK
jgi:exosortase A-associated hydrolase 1